MERPVFKPIGTPVEDLDTPALIVDADALEANLAGFRDGIDVRPSLDAHLSAEIATMQMEAGVTRFAASTIAQAEAFALHIDYDHGILIQNVVATPEDAARVARLGCKRPIAVGADKPAAVDLLAAAVAVEPPVFGLMPAVSVAVPIKSVSRSIGVAPEDAPAIARRVSDSPALRFAGVFSAPPLMLGNPYKDEKAALAALSEAAYRCAAYIDWKEARARFRTLQFIAARGSALYGDPALGDSAATELIAGSYALGDGRLIEKRPEIRPAAHILATVMSEQDPGMVWLDAGQKAVSIDTGLPLVDGIPHAAITRMSAEHGCMELSEGARWNVRLGDKIRLIPHDIANAVNVYDYIHVIQDGKLADIWRTVGRGGYG